ncbi:putative hydrolase of the HAD superfamily [Pedobacter sp. UYP30]|uniref:HAD family hydrolase n=1 Tax=Pedobacter sp. UYP30 TaxID=1756400 RepID=UPI00339B57C1
MQVIDWQKVELVVLDVDGTLYNQSLLRKKMLRILLLHFLLRPWQLKELWILYHFRKEREKHAGYVGPNLEQKQYEWCKTKTGVSLERIKVTIDKWMFAAPNKFLLPVVFPGVDTFFTNLKNRGIAIATLSDYPSKAKMEGMKLEANLNASATDAEINALKPATVGLEYVLKHFNISNPRNCLFIGDRLELDGACASSIGVQFLLVKQATAVADFYLTLCKQLNAI